MDSKELEFPVIVSYGENEKSQVLLPVREETGLSERDFTPLDHPTGLTRVQTTVVSDGQDHVLTKPAFYAHLFKSKPHVRTRKMEVDGCVCFSWQCDHLEQIFQLTD